MRATTLDAAATRQIAGVSRRRRRPGRIEPNKGACAESQQRGHEMRETADGQGGHRRPLAIEFESMAASREFGAKILIPVGIAADGLRRGPTIPRMASAPEVHIFMPPIVPPFVAPPPEAPTPSTGNSTSTGPACSNSSVALTVSPFVSGWVRWVNIR